MKKYFANIQDREGNAVAGAEVYIRDADTNSLLTIYSDNGVTTTTNPLTSNNDGDVSAYVPDGVLKVQVYIEGALESEKTGIQHYDDLDNEVKALRSVTSAPDKGFYFTGSGTGAVYDLTSGGRALGGLASAADKLPYFTGSGTASTADFTAAGRALLDDANAAAQLTTLGVSAFAQTILDDADAAAVRSTIGVPYRPISFFFTTTPTASEKLMLFVACQSITLADDFAGSTCSVGTNPTSSFVLDVQKNGVSVGSVTISTGGSATFATTGTTVSLASGDLLSVIAPGTPDATAANVAITLRGTL